MATPFGTESRSIILTGIRIRVLSEYDDFHFFERARVEDMENLMAGR